MDSLPAQFAGPNGTAAGPAVDAHGRAPDLTDDRPNPGELLPYDAIRAIAGVAGAWCPSLSPDNDRVAYVTDSAGAPRVVVASTGSVSVRGRAPAVEVAPDQEAISVAWSPDGEWLAYLVSPGGSIRAELWSVRPDGSDRHRVAGGVDTATVFAGGWTARPGWYAFSLADGVSGHAAVHQVDMTGPGTRSVVVGPTVAAGFCTVTAVGADGIIVRRGPRNERCLYLVRDDALVPLLPDGMTGEDGRFAAHAVYLRTPGGTDRLVLGRVPLTEHGPGPLEIVAARHDADVEAYAIRPDGSLLVVWNERGRSRLEIRRSGGDIQKIELPEPVMPGWSLGRGGEFLVAELTGPLAPRSLFHVDLRTGRTERLPAMPDFDLPACTIAPTLERFHAPDGTALDGWLYRPRTAHGPGPTVVTLHGGPESQERPAFSIAAQTLVSAGITVFAPNVRGSSGYGERFMHADNGVRRPDSFQDVLAAVDFLVDAGICDRDRIGVHGWSYGGYLSLVALSRWPQLFAAGAAHAGMSDLRTFFAQTETWMAAASVTEYGDPVTESELLRELSPELSRISAPTLLLHGDQDSNVPVAESRQAHSALTAAGRQSELLLLPGEGHTIVGVAGRIHLACALGRWFLSHLVRTRAEDEIDGLLRLCR